MENVREVGGIRQKNAVACQNLFRRIVSKAEHRGMKVNASKTSMLWVSGATSYTASAHIIDSGGNKIESGTDLKVLGFNLSSRPGFHSHVEALRKRFRKRYWCLYLSLIHI